MTDRTQLSLNFDAWGNIGLSVTRNASVVQQRSRFEHVALRLGPQFVALSCYGYCMVKTRKHTNCGTKAADVPGNFVTLQT